MKKDNVTNQNLKIALTVGALKEGKMIGQKEYMSEVVRKKIGIAQMEMNFAFTHLPRF